MKLTVVKGDNTVYVDGKPLSVDCGDLPDFLHAIQWDEDKGHLEFEADASGTKMPNITFNDLTPYKFLVDRWHQRRDSMLREEQEAETMTKQQDEELRRQREEIRHAKREPDAPVVRRPTHKGKRR